MTLDRPPRASSPGPPLVPHGRGPGPGPFRPLAAPPPPRPAPPSAGGKAILSLTFGILSLFGCGALFSVPAIVLGFAARREGARSAEGSSSEGLAMGGIVTGTIGAAITAIAVVALLLGLAAGLATARPDVAADPPQASAAPATPDDTESQEPRAKPVVVRTSIDVVTLTPSAKRLRDQLRGELHTAEAHGEKLLVQTTATWAPVCGEIDVSLGDPRMETALSKVRLVRVDVDSFETDLKAMRMYEGNVPWFFVIDARTARPIDAIGADEWDDNVAENMAPVLGSFVKGTYRERRHGSPLGGTSL